MSENDCDASIADERLLVHGRLYVQSDLSGLDWMMFRELQQVRPHVLRHMLERDDRRDRALKLVAAGLAKRLRATDWLVLTRWYDPRGSITGQYQDDELPLELPYIGRRI